MRAEDGTALAAHWLHERTGYTLGPEARSVAAVDSAGSARGMVAFDRWTPNAAHVHIALDTPAALRHLLPAACKYLFGQCGRGVALATVRAGNTRSLRLSQRLGFVETHRMRDGWAPGEDVVYLEMRRESCRWMETP